jgi:hypothetical protein
VSDGKVERGDCVIAPTSTNRRISRMSAPESQIRGYAVTLEVIVPFEVAQQTADQLDAAWHLESWSPEAAAFVAIEKALRAAGLHHEVHVRTREVNGHEPGASA